MDDPPFASIPRGSLSWTHLSEGDRTTFDDWQLLEEAYKQRFEDLKRQGILRDALLKTNGETVHFWSCAADKEGKGEPGGTSNGGPVTPARHSGVAEGPPSVS